MKHTPEPWEVERDDEIFGRYRLVGVDAAECKRIDEGYAIDEEGGDGEEGDRRDAEARERDEANRRLIQSTPKLYELCKEYLSMYDDYLKKRIIGNGSLRHYENVVKLLAEIEGR